MPASKRAKALSIPKEVKDVVWDRDGHRCIICGSRYAYPDSHFIRRSHGGLGIPQNIVTMCRLCHDTYDNGPSECRHRIANKTEEWLRICYPDWNRESLVYRKE